MLKTFLYKVVLPSVLLLIVLTEVKSASAQTYTMTNGSVSTCSGTLLDPGGNANYPNNANFTYTICSSNGTHVNAKFTLFKTSANDILYVYDGNGITAPLIGTYTDSLTYPPSLTSSGNCLTFKFVSDATTNNTGFSATISCVASPIKVDNTTYTQSQLISSVFMGDCLTATNIQFHGMNDMMGYFSNGNSIGIPTGVVLTSGSIFNVPGPNNQANATIDHSQPSDVQLTAAVGVNTQDASSIEFDFVPKNDSVTFQFVFASEEYPEWICQGYNDAFGFFVTGTGYAANTNVALIPGTTTPIAIDNINTTGSCTTIYPQYYVNNTGGTACQYYGYTVPMNCVIHCVQCETYHIKIAVADVGDGLYDSGVFLKAQSFSAGHNIVVSATGQNGSTIYEGCNGYFTFTNLDGIDSLPYNIYYQILETANNGADYQTITNMVTIPAGQTSVTLPINTLLDANIESSEWVRVRLLAYCNCNNIPQATLIIADNSNFNAIVSPDQSICQGQSGSITISATGNQNLPYHYLWNTGATASSITISPLTTNNYRVTVTNPCNNQMDTASTTITVIPDLNLSSSVSTNVNCNGNNNGSINLSVTGGQSPYSFAWSNGATTQNISSLSPATYTVTVTAGVCSTTSTFTITQPNVLGLSLLSVNPSCNGVLNGSVSSTVTGGTSLYNYLWNNGATTANRSSLAAGTYSLTVTDANGCTNTATAAIINTTSISVSASATNSLCFGGSNGTASSTVTGGTSPYTYLWNLGATTANRTGLTAANYSLTVTDANGCTATASTTVSQPTALSVSASSTNVSCNSGTNGTALSSVTGGISPYTYLWNNGATIANRTSLSAGTYLLTVTDANGCTATSSTTVSQPTTLSVSTSSTNALCNAASNGTATSSVTGGSSPFTYAWSNGATNSNIASLSANTYSVTVTDAKGCTATSSTTVSQPNTLSVSEIHNDATCSLLNGNVSLTTTGGTTPYSYAWSNSATTDIINNLFPSNYSVTVLDANSCSVALSVNIINSSSPVASTVNAAICNGAIYTLPNGTSVTAWGTYTSTLTSVIGCDSVITTNLSVNSVLTSLVNAQICSGGNYVLSNGASVSAAGIYTTTLTSVSGCDSVIITTLSVGGFTLTAINTNSTCGLQNGNINLSVVGGIAPFNYNWSNGNTNQDLQNISSGNYSVTVSDNSGCSKTLTTILNNTAGVIGVNLTINYPTCTILTNGSVFASGNGSSAPYTYHWSTGSNLPFIFGVSTGNYYLTVTSASGCSLDTSIYIPSPVSIFVIDSVVPSVCGNFAAQLYVSVTGGSMPYQYHWSNGATIEDLLYINGGVYNLTVTDSHNCMGLLSVNITNILLPYLTETHVDASCGNATGSVDLVPSGGNLPYHFQWSNGQTTEDATNLTAGIYSVSAFDANGCTSSLNVTINNSNGPVLSETYQDDYCAHSIASIDLTIFGGAAPYQINWSNGSTSEDLNNISAGNYSVIVVDANGCSVSSVINVNGLSGQTVTLNSISPVCNGSSNGAISLNVLGGVLNLNFVWSNGMTSQNLNNVGAGNYSVTVTDGFGCVVSSSATLINPASQAASTVNAQICSGGNYVLPNGASTSSAGQYITTLTSVNGCDSVITTNLSVNSVLTSTVNAQICSGGNYVLPNGTSVNTAGTYTSTLTSVSGCDSVITTILNVGTSTATESHIDAACGMANASINLSVSGGISPYNYTWSNGATTANISMLSANNYFVTVTDNNSCQSILSVNISNLNGPVLTENHVNSSCGNPNGAVDLTVAGGAPMNFIWSNAAVSEDINNIPQGIYSVTVSDANNCVASLNISVGGNNIPAVSETHIDANCNGNNGSVNLTVGGGAPAYTYLWSNGITTEDQQNLSSGNYLVTVTDVNTCKSILSLNIINQISNLAIGETHIAPVCGQSNGGIDVTVSGGVTPYDYEWDNNATTEDLSGITSGIYAIEVEDAVGCQATLTVAITCVLAPPCLLTITASAINTSCSNPNSGGANLLITNSVSTLSYLWSNGNTTQNINSIAAGNYSVTVDDAIGCSVTTTVNVLNTNGPSVIDSHANTSCGNSNGSINLTVGGGTSPYNYLWTNGFTTQNLINLPASDYFVTVTDANNCIATLHVFIENSTATKLIETHANASCGNNNGSIDLTVTSGIAPYSFIWNSGATAEDPINMPAGNYIVTLTDAFACSASTSIIISNTSSPNISETHVDASCGNFNGSINLTVSGGASPYSYQWNNFATTQDITNLMTGNYLVTVTDANNCVAIMSVLIDNLNGPSLNVSTANPSCGQSNGAIDLQVNGGIPPYTFSWINGATTSTLTNLGSGNYSVTVSDQSGCSLFTNTSLISTSSPSINLNSISSTICVGNATTISATGASTYTWSPSTGLNVTTGNNVVANPTVTTTYSVTGSTSGGCSASSTVVITVSAILIISVVPTTSFICAGGSTSITAIGASTYSWSPSASLSSATAASVTASPNNTTTYTVTGTSNGCIAQATTVVNLISATTINLNTIDTSICLGNSLVITASGSGTNYTWSPSTGLSATTGNTVSANPNATTVYNVVTTNAGGCSSSSSVLVNVNALPTVSVSPNNNNICAGGIVVMNASGTGTYTWSPSAGLNINSGAQVVATPSNTITYTVTGIDLATGCSAQATNIITIIAAPAVTVFASSISICAGQNTVLTASGANAYAWYPSTGLSTTNGASVIAIPDSNMTYIVVGFVPTGCTDTASITITVGTLPDVIVDVLHDEGCEPLTVTFDNHTTGAATFNWSFGDNNSSTNVSPVHTYTSQGTYPLSLVVTSAAGCSDTLSNLATIKVHPTPVADFTVNPALGVVTTINDATFTFLNHSTNATNYKWFFGDRTTDTYLNTSHTYLNAGEFNVTLISSADYDCADTLTLYPIVIVEDGTVFIPNAFTPNGDGMNDVFNIFGTGIQHFTLTIFDRLGEMVYQGDEASAGWDATFKGQPVNLGVFVYVAGITYDDGTKANKKGDVTAVR